MDRRTFLKAGLGAAGAAAVAGGVQLPASTPALAKPPPPAAKRLLVVIDMAGGNDGYSTVVPYANGRYYDLRSTVAVPAGDVIPITNKLGLHPALEKVSRHRLAVLEGVGHMNPDLSHFESLRRWWQGDQDGANALAIAGTGFLGRICDVVGDPAAPASGVSIGWGPSSMLTANEAVTLSVNPYGDAAYPGTDNELWMSAQRTMSDPDVSETNATLIAGRRGIGAALRFSDVVAALPTADEVAYPYPDTDLGRQLQLAMRFIRGNASSGVRCIHIPFGGDFDTHEGHFGRHSALMQTFDDAMDPFLRELKGRNKHNRVVVATISEFGRRPEQNTDGLDHGSASAVLLFGSVQRGVHGAAPSWGSLDEDDNLVPTVTMAEYYASLARWLGVRPTDVLAGDPKPVKGLVRYK